MVQEQEVLDENGNGAHFMLAALHRYAHPTDLGRLAYPNTMTHDHAREILAWAVFLGQSNLDVVEGRCVGLRLVSDPDPKRPVRAVFDPVFYDGFNGQGAAEIVLNALRTGAQQRPWFAGLGIEESAPKQLREQEPRRSRERAPGLSSAN